MSWGLKRLAYLIARKLRISQWHADDNGNGTERREDFENHRDILDTKGRANIDQKANLNHKYANHNCKQSSRSSLWSVDGGYEACYCLREFVSKITSLDEIAVPKTTSRTRPQYGRLNNTLSPPVE